MLASRVTHPSQSLFELPQPARVIADERALTATSYGLSLSDPKNPVPVCPDVSDLLTPVRREAIT